VRYEIHFIIDAEDDAAVEAAVNKAYYLIEDQLDGVGSLDAQAYQRSDEEAAAEATGWHGWDDDCDETFYRRRT